MINEERIKQLRLSFSSGLPIDRIVDELLDEIERLRQIIEESTVLQFKKLK